ncbi:hypothetical protein AWH56_020725 [Anaerobacillus isosaccharinicus]|uniref:Uncharacterized protein n=1 Tax=Anaerobacillus isosaccharinicus TaxID=1532552 RepID=A0A7S7L664_9BACI|nr:hypothetical protein [Anaerobacillus isosaccharinicus]MBA5586668.1 hypothetical protein [Anaerobacillus isosaccharinicus]QOY35100.1 hypothetical protein AWH56_020725 [Anaerobacillus isosaccharinicus]
MTISKKNLTSPAKQAEKTQVPMDEKEQTQSKTNAQKDGFRYDYDDSSNV